MMEEQGLDALILGGNAEATQRGYIRYTADWRLWGGKGFVVFPREGEPTLVLGAGSQSYWSQVTGWIPDVRAAGDMVAEVINIVHAQGLGAGGAGRGGDEPGDELRRRDAAAGGTQGGTARRRHGAGRRRHGRQERRGAGAGRRNLPGGSAGA